MIEDRLEAPFFRRSLTEGGVDVRGRWSSNPTSGCHSLEGKFSPERIVIEFFIEGMVQCQ